MICKTLNIGYNCKQNYTCLEKCIPKFMQLLVKLFVIVS